MALSGSLRPDGHGIWPERDRMDAVATERAKPVARTSSRRFGRWVGCWLPVGLTTTTSHDLERVAATPAESPGSRARRVEDPDIDAILDALVDPAPPLPYEVRARVAFLLGGHRRATRPGEAA